MHLDILLLSLVFGVSIYAERGLPILLFSSAALPKKVVRWLEFVAPAVFAAILAPAVFTIEGADKTHVLSFSLYKNPALWATVPAFLIAWRGSFFGTVAVGMGVVALIRLVLG